MYLQQKKLKVGLGSKVLELFLTYPNMIKGIDALHHMIPVDLSSCFSSVCVTGAVAGFSRGPLNSDGMIANKMIMPSIRQARLMALRKIGNWLAFAS